MNFIGLTLPPWAVAVCLIAAGVAAGVVAGRLLLAVAQWLVRQGGAFTSHINVARLKLPVYFAMPILCAFVAVWMVFPTVLQDPVARGVIKVASVVLIYWLLLRVIEIVSAAVVRHYDITVRDNMHARRVRTQISVVKSIVSVALFLAAMATIFMLFDTLRGLGVSLLASAGVAGLAIGFAAQKTLGNVLAGIQIALTQPIRLEDAIVVEDEWGWVEEITLTYVVVRLWDLRRLVLPISYFIEHPFQNWTRKSAAIIGTVEIFADFTLPLEPVREELKRLLDSTPLWDGKTQVVQVTEMNLTTMKVRILVSAADSPTAFDLRCYVREQMIDFIGRNYPQSLPRQRLSMRELDRSGDATQAVAAPV